MSFTFTYLLRMVMASDLADLQAQVVAGGYTHDFSSDVQSLQMKGTNELLALNDLRVVDTITFDVGTDPGDDTTMYLIESGCGQNGYLILPDSFHVDPRKAAFIEIVLTNNGMSA